MAFQLHMVGPETGIEYSDILNHFKTGLQNCSSPVFSDISFVTDATEYYGESFERTFVFTPVTDNTKPILYNDWDSSGGKKGIHIPNASGVLRKNSNIGTPAMLMRYYTWNGGAMYLFGTSTTGETDGGTMLVFVKDNLGSPVVASTAGVSNMTDSLFTNTSVANGYKWATIRDLDEAFEAGADIAYDSARQQVLLMPYTCNCQLNQTVYTPNAFIMPVGPRVNVTSINAPWHFINLNNETFLTNSYIAFREERSSS